jgi:hypothetical protein
VAKFGPSTVADLILSFLDSKNPPEDIRKIVKRLCIERGGLNATEAEEKSEIWLTKIIFNLEKKVELLNTTGRSVRIRKVTDDWSFICGGACVLPADPESTHDAIKNRSFELGRV